MTFVRFAHPAYAQRARFFDDARTQRQAQPLPRVNILETEQEFVLEFAVPGRKREDFQLSVADQRLHLKAAAPEPQATTYRRQEFGHESFERSFLLPENVDQAAIEASYEAGILRIHLRKVQPSRKEIAIQ